jgi:hypothetical protein
MLMHTPPPPPPKPMPITIFVHGTQMSALFKDIDMRSIVPAVMQTPAGLIAAKSLPENHMVRMLFDALSKANPQQFPFAGIYAFGWSGGIQVKERMGAAKTLFNLIRALTQEYEKLHDSVPEITLITHSHGGNVILHLTECCEDVPISIKRALLLACPVQEQTAAYTQHSLFQSLYSLHSHDDLLQIIDQGSLQLPRKLIETWQQDKVINPKKFIQTIRNNKWQLGSGRHFSTQNNLIQAELTWQSEPMHQPYNVDKGLIFERALYKATHPFSPTNRGVLHTEFTTPAFFKQIPDIIQNLDTEWAKNGPVSHCLTLSIAGS